MRPDERDAAYIWDMLDAAQTVEQLFPECLLSIMIKTEELSLQ